MDLGSRGIVLPVAKTKVLISCTVTASLISVFLFRILGIGAGPSELGKSAREIWNLGKVEMCLKP